jgi:hypothetical protein
MNELPESMRKGGQLAEDLKTIRSLLGPDILSRPHYEAFVRALRSLSGHLGPAIERHREDPKS